MKAVGLFVSLMLGASSAWSLDCRVNYSGRALSGYAQGKTTTSTKYFSDYSEAQCKAIALNALQPNMIVEYTSERVWTSKHRLSPLSKSHYLKPDAAKWCTGDSYVDLYFDELDCGVLPIALTSVSK